MSELLVQSADGTNISSQSHGEGRPLVIVSGALFASELWQRVLPLLGEGRRVLLLDRRGRGKSGDQPSYQPEREVEDLLAVLSNVPGPVDLLGHSSGAILSLQVAQRAPSNLERLVVYEPPVFFSEADGIEQDLPERLDALLAAGDAEGAVETFLREGPRATEAELRDLRAGRSWAHLVKALAHTVPYDSRIQRAYSAGAEELSRVRVPTLMLLGSNSPQRMRSGAEAIVSRLPNAQLVELSGQQHVAMLVAPAAFAGAVNAFLSLQPAA